jgi:hypothetical protein
MTVFIELEEDPYTEAFDSEAEVARNTEVKARRPLRGIQLRKDTVAYISVINSKGEAVKLIDAGGEETDEDGKGRSQRYTNFMVQGYNIQRAEKSQIMETFGQDYVFFFGEKTKVYQINAILMHTADFDWRNEMLYNYEHTLRGTELVRQNARAYLYQDGVLWEGYLMSLNMQQNSQVPYHVQFSFQFLVTNETLVDDVGDTSFPTRAGYNLLNQSWAFDVLLKWHEQNRSVIPERTNFATDLANLIQYGSRSVGQGFEREGALRTKISDNVDEYLGGAALKPKYSETQLANARRKQAVRETLYLIKEQYLRAKFVIDSAYRLSRGEQNSLSLAFGATFVVTSLARAALPDPGVI